MGTGHRRRNDSKTPDGVGEHLPCCIPTSPGSSLFSGAGQFLCPWSAGTPVPKEALMPSPALAKWHPSLFLREPEVDQAQGSPLRVSVSCRPEAPSHPGMPRCCFSPSIDCRRVSLGPWDMAYHCPSCRTDSLASGLSQTGIRRAVLAAEC